MIHQDVDATLSQDIKNILYDEILWEMGGLLENNKKEQIKMSHEFHFGKFVLFKF